jgi:hypothetical protein
MAYARRPGKLPLPARWIAGLLLIKLCWALGYSYYFFQLHPHTSDVWDYFAQSRQIVRETHSFRDFVWLAFPTVTHAGDLLHYAFWNDLKNNLYVLLLLLMNLFTWSNPYADTLLFALLTFTGWIRFIRLLQALYPGLKPGWYCAPFLLPTFLFCFSGLHSDGLIFALLGWIAWDAYQVFVLDPPSPERVWIRLAVCCFLLACMKAYLFVFLILVLAPAWYGVYRRGLRPVYAWALMAGLGVSVFLLTIPEQSARQQAYLSLPYQHFLPEPSLDTSLRGYLLRFPLALWNGFFRPGLSGPYILSTVETWSLLLLFLYSVAKRVRRSFYENTWLYLTCITWLLVGYTIPILGAVIRYRSLFFPFLLGFCLLPLVSRGNPLRQKGLSQKAL